MKALIVFLYVVVCFLLIFAVLLQNNKGAQMSSGFSSNPSKSFFGSAGAKGFLYTSTKWLIFFFFSLAFIQTGLDYREHHRVESVLSLMPLPVKTS